MSNALALDLFPGWSNNTTALFPEVTTFDVFDSMLWSTLIIPLEWLSAEKQAFVNIWMSLLFLNLSLASGTSKPEEFHKNCTTL